MQKIGQFGGWGGQRTAGFLGAFLAIVASEELRFSELTFFSIAQRITSSRHWGTMVPAMPLGGAKVRHWPEALVLPFKVC